MNAAEPPDLDPRTALCRGLSTTITHILGYTEMLQEEAEELGQEMFLPDLQKIQTTGRQLIALVHELAGASIAKLEDVDFPRLRFEVRTALNHTVGYTEMLQERAAELDQSGFLRDLDRILTACRQLLALAETAQPGQAGEDLADGEPSPDPAADTTVRTLGTLLVVDDNMQNRENLGGLLRRQGYRVMSAGSGLSAMERIRAHKFDLILLDVVMPGMNGYEVLQWLKADAHLRDIPVLMIAAMNDTENVVRCLVIGAEDYVTKPFDPVLLKARVGSSLERSRWRHKEETYQRQIAEEQAHSEQLLHNILPRSIAGRLRRGEATIIDDLPSVTILFADLVPFTSHTANLPAGETVRLINDIFTAFDLLAEQYHVEKLKTIGDAYMAASGLVADQQNHARAIAEFALALQREIASFRAKTGRSLHLRIGIHSGPVVAGIIGLYKISYDLWGATVNTASYIESSGELDRIHISPATHALLRDHYQFEERHHIEVHGHGRMNTYFLLGARQ